MLIGVSGKQRAGKDTVADYLVRYHGFKKVSLADPLKKLAVEYFGLSYKDVYETKPEKVRKVLQYLGKVGREVDKDFWIKKALSRYHPSEDWVISDVRFKNEAQHIKNLEGILIRIEADRDVREQRGLLYNEDDVSETDLDDYKYFDYYVFNNYDVESLYFEIEKVLEDIYRIKK